MTAKKDMGPAVRRALLWVIAIDAVAIGIAIGGYLLTDNMVALLAPIALSAPVVAYLLFNAKRQDKLGPAAPNMRSIVE